MDWIKFAQYLLDNNLIINYDHPLIFVRRLPKTVSAVNTKYNSTQLDYIEIEFKEGSKAIIRYPFTDKVLSAEKAFRRTNKLNMI